MSRVDPNPELYNLPWTTESFNDMPYRLIGKSGLRASNVGLGTWKMGYPETGDGARVDEKTAMDIFDRAIELGVTFWDTANRYNASSGNSERLIGKWLKDNPDQRRNIVLATKMFGGMDGWTPNHSRLSRLNILESVYASLERLQLDCIDMLYFHNYDDVTPVEESLSAIEDLIQQDLLRYFAVSNFSTDQLSTYFRHEKQFFTRCRPVAVQNKFDILDGESEQYQGVLAFCDLETISFIPYSPLAKGLLTDRYLEPEEAGKGDRLVDEGTLDEELTADKKKKLEALAKLAKSWDLEISRLALAYTLTLPGMGPVIPSASTVEQLESNASAGKIELSSEQIKEIETVLA